MQLPRRRPVARATRIGAGVLPSRVFLWVRPEREPGADTTRAGVPCSERYGCPTAPSRLAPRSWQRDANHVQTHVLECTSASHDAVWNLPSDASRGAHAALPRCGSRGRADASEAEEARRQPIAALGWAADAAQLRARAETPLGPHRHRGRRGPMLFPAHGRERGRAHEQPRPPRRVDGRATRARRRAELHPQLHVARDEQHAGRWSQAKMRTTGPPFGELAGGNAPRIVGSERGLGPGGARDGTAPCSRGAAPLGNPIPRRRL